MQKYFFFFFILIQTLAGAAEDCAAVDLNQAEDSPFRKMPIYDQSGSGTCYAHTAVQLIDYWRMKHEPEKVDYLTEPIYAAWVSNYEEAHTVVTKKFIFKQKDKYPEYDHQTIVGGNVSNVLDAIRTRGVCRKNGVDERMENFKQGSDYTNADVAHLFELLSKKADPRTSVYLDQKMTTQKLMDKWLSENMNTLTATQALRKVFQGCQPHVSLAHVPRSELKVSRDKAINMKNLNELLTAKNPTGISICGRILPDERHRPQKGDDCGYHTVVVTARKKFENSCKYLIRNSWGNQWHPKELVCACIDSKGQYQDVCTTEKPKEYVGCWVAQDTLSANLFDVTYIP